MQKQRHPVANLLFFNKIDPGFGIGSFDIGTLILKYPGQNRIATRAQIGRKIACERYPADASLRAFFDPAGERVKS